MYHRTYKGIVEVPDLRLNRLAEIAKPQKVVPTIIEFVDIAGLVKGASQREGLGNKFLSHIREVDAICHVVRAFEDENIIHVNGKVNPVEDAAIVNMELIFADLDSADKQFQRVSKNAKNGNKEAQEQTSVLEKILILLKAGKPARLAELKDEEKNIAKSFQLITLKPVMYVANIADKDAAKKDTPLLNQIRQMAKEENAELVILCGRFEEEISGLDRNEQLEFLKEIGETESGLDRMIKTAYKLLGLITFLPQEKQKLGLGQLLSIVPVLRQLL
ncbi:putative GTP-binding protein YchF [Leptospira interrogans serovar Bataviae str. HAI135]|nr:putative GTP-binding protein YchF [Leptospira interrogans serovar Bataviae str. HAI135]